MPSATTDDIHCIYYEKNIIILQKAIFVTYEVFHHISRHALSSYLQGIDEFLAEYLHDEKLAISQHFATATYKQEVSTRRDTGNATGATLFNECSKLYNVFYYISRHALTSYLHGIDIRVFRRQTTAFQTCIVAVYFVKIKYKQEAQHMMRHGKHYWIKH